MEQPHLDDDLVEPAQSAVVDAARHRRRTALAFAAAGLGVVAGVWALSGVVAERRHTDLLKAQADALGAYTQALAEVEGTHLSGAIEARLLRRVLPNGVATPSNDDAVTAACDAFRKSAFELKAQQDDLSACEALAKRLPGCEKASDGKRTEASREELQSILEAIDGCAAALNETLGEDGSVELAERGELPPTVNPLGVPPAPDGHAHVGERPHLFVGDRIQLFEAMYRPECEKGKNQLECRAWATHELVDGRWNTENVAVSPMLDETGDQVTLADIEPLGDWTRGTVVEGPNERPAPLSFSDGSELRLVNARNHLVALRSAKGEETGSITRVASVSGRCTVRYAKAGRVGIVCTGNDTTKAQIFVSLDGGATWQGAAHGDESTP